MLALRLSLGGIIEDGITLGTWPLSWAAVGIAGEGLADGGGSIGGLG